MPENPFHPWIPPFRYEPNAQIIQDAQNNRLLDIRGWGYLTGSGQALATPHSFDEAAKIQDRIGELVATRLNALDGTSDLCALFYAYVASQRCAQQALRVMRDALKNGMHASRPKVEQAIPRLEKDLQTSRQLSQTDNPVMDLLSAAKFVLYECDWEQADTRIGPALMPTIKAMEKFIQTKPQ